MLQVGPELAVDTPVLTQIADGSGTDADAATNGTVTLVVWVAQAGGEKSILGKRLDADGSVLDAAPIVIAAAPGAEETPAVASDGTGFFVVWYTADGVKGTRVSAGGQVLDPGGIPIIGPGAGSPEVGFGAGVYLVTFQASQGLFTTRVSTSGQLLDASPLLLAGGLAYREPRVASNGTDFLVVFRKSLGFVLGNDLYHVRVSGSGALLDAAPVPVHVTEDDENYYEVASDGAGYMVVWQSFSFGTFAHTGYATTVSAAGVVSPPVVHAAGAQGASIGHDGTRYLVSWHDADFTNVYGRRFSNAGAALDPAPFLVSGAPMVQTAPTVTAAPGGFVTAWQDSRNGPSPEIFATRVTGAGVVSDPAGIQLSATGTATKANAQGGPAVATNGSTSLLV